jgi:hypothetical protein
LSVICVHLSGWRAFVEGGFGTKPTTPSWVGACMEI